MSALEQELSALLRGRLVGHVLVVGKCPVDLEITGVRAAKAPADRGELQQLGADYDAAVIAGWGKDLEAEEVARALRERVRVGGSVVFLVPTSRRGWRGARSALLGAFRGQAPVPFEELCEAVFRAGLRAIVARELEGGRGLGLIAARVVESAAQAGESSVRTLSSLREPSQKIG